MAKPKRKPKPSRASKAKKKVNKIKHLKKKVAHRAKPAPKKVKAAKKPLKLKKVLAKKAVAPQPRAAAGKPAAKAGAKPEEKKGKPTIKSAKAALELLEANVAAAKGKGVKGRPGRKGKKDAWLIPPEMPKEDAETRRTRLKNLIKLGKDRGFLTYSEINDHLPDDLVDAEQIEAIISTFGDMGIQVYDQAPDQEQLLISPDQPAATPSDDDVEEQAEAALSTVDSEFGRTTDPVRMYMREMGSVELLTREGEIEIAKRIEDGLKHMVMAISACPTTIADILAMAERVANEEIRIDELVDGLIDANAEDVDGFSAQEAEAIESEDEEAEEEDT